jgi:signal transduction histidine kinase
MINRAGDVSNWFGTCTDVENQKRAEKALMEIEKLETLGILAGGLAHDFNNLLVGILGGASLVMDTLPAVHSGRDILNDVIHAGEEAAELTRKMLAYSGRANFFVERVDLDQLARETCRFLRHSIPIGIQLQFHSGSPLPEIETDIHQLRHLIVELVMNAVEAIGNQNSGRIWVRSTVVEVDPVLVLEGRLEAAAGNGASFVALEVQDTGCGMDETTQAKIFDPFFSTKFTGRGLGLSAVKGFVRSNGGAIRVRSVPGEGALFQVALPVAIEKRCQSATGGDT